MKALVTAPFTEACLNELREAGVEVEYRSWRDTGKLHLGDSMLEVISQGDYDIVIVEGDEIKEEVIQGTDLKLIACVRGGPNNISIEAATKKGIPVVSAPGRNTTAVAELTISLILSTARRLTRADRLLVRDEFMVDDFGDFGRLHESTIGFELSGKTVGIIGLGQIGLEVAKRLCAFDVRLLVYDPYVAEDKLKSVGATESGLDDLLQESDVVTIHVPATEETRGLLSAEKLGLMKETSILINTSRASVTDEDALFEALKSKRIAGAGLDVFTMEPVDCDNIFLELDNVTVTPHIGGNTRETIERQSEMLTKDIKAFLNGEKPLHILNPEVLKG
ncbi:MAG: hydroxyacid dehydrogenase [Candidatus Thorarchaeota archaeon]|nr:MAG: hydroxyacid dehydrogenase [Candidatus Thorarchaeota archaeon]